MKQKIDDKEIVLEGSLKDRAGKNARPGSLLCKVEMLVLARRIAEAHIDLRRVRYARHHFLSNALNDPSYDTRANMRNKMAVIRGLLRPKAPEIPIAGLEKLLTFTPKGPDKFSAILSQEVEQLLALDRYERRALSRRKFAIRAFDAACRKE